jgi:signal transduction histidine kinase
MTELAQIVAGWPLALSMAATVAAQGLRNGRRRSALNEALHELRRPLQAVALAAGPRVAAPGEGDDPIGLAAAALERLDREINGIPPAPVWGVVDAHTLAQAAVGRWQARARLCEARLELRWNAGMAFVNGDRSMLAQALDNLIVNAIEHGGPVIELGARRHGRRLRIAIADSGRDGPCPRRRRATGAAIARLAAAGRRGHGLNIVRRVASAHGGRFELRHSELGSVATLDLPLADERA